MVLGINGQKLSDTYQQNYMDNENQAIVFLAVKTLCEGRVGRRGRCGGEEVNGEKRGHL